MYLDKDAYGIAAILGSLATLLLAFMWGRKEQRKEKEQAMQKLLKKTRSAEAD